MPIKIEEKTDSAPVPVTESAGSPPRKRSGVGGGLFDRSDGNDGVPPVFYQWEGQTPKEPSSSQAATLEKPTHPPVRTLTMQEYIGAVLPPEPIDIMLIKGAKKLFRWISSR